MKASEWLETFGLSVDEHTASTQIDLTEGFVSSDISAAGDVTSQPPTDPETMEVVE